MTPTHYYLVLLSITILAADLIIILIFKMIETSQSFNYKQQTTIAVFCCSME